MLPERYETKIDRETSSGCWIFTGSVTANGYGRVWNGTKTDWAHRVYYRLVRGEIPSGLVLDHLCRNRRCVNPSHLEAVSDRENTIRGDCPDVTRQRHRAKTHCKRGHPLFGSNLYRNPNGRRVCRACNADHKATYLARNSDVLLELANKEAHL
ncbi:HNH endonuclease signature motif containing protein [Novosphingobium sp.]|uniref:HNH endonuclease signature motif containing protein n=1 Tax=Novosphingobium sp. TaxID=1874826 RepID=UPI003917F8DB